MNLPIIQVHQDEGALWSFKLLTPGGTILSEGEGHPTEEAARLAAATLAARLIAE